LIAASIMSKKLASGANSILLDVKVGSGAFMKDLDKARELAQLMVEIGRAANKPTIAVITDMNAPTGYAIGNSLEVAESLEILRGRGASDLREICIELAAGMLELAGFSKKDGLDMAINSLESGIALKKFNELVIAQGGKIELMETAPVIRKISSNVQGYIKEMDTEGLGIVACMLGAGRNNPNDSVYPLSGILLHKKPADYVYQGETIAELHTSSIEMLSPAIDKFLDSISFSNTPCMKKPLILGVLS
ncbi:MAG: thymidine phosphorylase, partial [Defluviitaleaceae bacterium]|nr:thymidine phosphorylase [Defluviitaleaceae bacterium]